MLSILPIKITAPYLKWKPGMVVLVSGSQRSAILSAKAGEVFTPKKPMKREEFALVSVRPELIHPDVIEGARQNPLVAEAIKLRDSILAKKKARVKAK
jgi:hypothetical protein